MSDKTTARSASPSAADSTEQKGLVTDVVVPIAEAAATGLGIGVGSKIGQGKKPPPKG